MRLGRSWLLGVVLACAAGSPRAHAIASWEETAGDVLTGVIPIGAFFYTYKYDDDEGRKQFYWCIGANEVLNSVARLAFNQTYLGERPNGNEYAFPSGHVGFISSAAGFLYLRYGWEYGLPAYAATAYVAYTRVETDHHRWRDVVAAAALAQTVAFFTVTAKKEPEIVPVLGPGYVGLQWNRSFGSP